MTIEDLEKRFSLDRVSGPDAQLIELSDGQAVLRPAVKLADTAGAPAVRFASRRSAPGSFYGLRL
jgi:hypothetical protein